MEPIPVDQLTRYYAEKKSTRFSVAHTCYLIIFDKSTKKVLWLSTLQSCATDVHVCVHGPFWSVKLKQQIFSVRLIDHTPGLRPMLPLHYWECSDLQHPDVGQDKLTWREKKKKKKDKNSSTHDQLPQQSGAKVNPHCQQTSLNILKDHFHPAYNLFELYHLEKDSVP